MGGDVDLSGTQLGRRITVIVEFGGGVAPVRRPAHQRDIGYISDDSIITTVRHALRKSPNSLAGGWIGRPSAAVPIEACAFRSGATSVALNWSGRPRGKPP
jgi:hypothetical protein